MDEKTKFLVYQQSCSMCEKRPKWVTKFQWTTIYGRWRHWSFTLCRHFNSVFSIAATGLNGIIFRGPVKRNTCNVQRPKNDLIFFFYDAVQVPFIFQIYVFIIWKNMTRRTWLWQLFLKKKCRINHQSEHLNKRDGKI